MLASAGDGHQAGETGAAARRRRPGLAWPLLLAFALVLGGAIGAVALHDHLIGRAELRPSLAAERARHLLCDPRSGADLSLLAAQGLEPARRVELLEGDRYRVAFDVRLATEVGIEPASLSIRCTVRCDEIDDWTLERLEVGDLPPHACDVRMPPSGRASALWSRRIRSWLGV